MLCYFGLFTIYLLMFFYYLFLLASTWLKRKEAVARSLQGLQLPKNVEFDTFWCIICLRREVRYDKFMTGADMVLK